MKAKVLGIKEIQKPDPLGEFDLSFSDVIRLRSSAKSWSSENEGASLLDIKFDMSESTKEILDES